MSYIDGFVIPVPAENKQAYIDMAKKAQAIYLEYGALRVVEWADKATRDAGNKKIMADPRMQPTGDMPFSGARVIYGGFSTLLDTNKE